MLCLWLTVIQQQAEIQAEHLWALSCCSTTLPILFIWYLVEFGSGWSSRKWASSRLTDRRSYSQILGLVQAGGINGEQIFAYAPLWVVCDQMCSSAVWLHRADQAADFWESIQICCYCKSKPIYSDPRLYSAHCPEYTRNTSSILHEAPVWLSQVNVGVLAEYARVISRSGR